MDLSSVEIPPPMETVSCLFCQGSVAFIKFFHHLQTHHFVVFEHQLILKLTLLGKKAIEEIIHYIEESKINEKEEKNNHKWHFDQNRI